MAKQLKPIKYIDYKVNNVIKIKEKFGFRVFLTLEDNSSRPVQHSGFLDKVTAEKERYKIIAKLENQEYVVYTNVNVQTYMEHWYEYVLPSRLNSEASFDVYHNCVFNHIIPNIRYFEASRFKKGTYKKII